MGVRHTSRPSRTSSLIFTSSDRFLVRFPFIFCCLTLRRDQGSLHIANRGPGSMSVLLAPAARVSSSHAPRSPPFVSSNEILTVLVALIIAAPGDNEIRVGITCALQLGALLQKSGCDIAVHTSTHLDTASLTQIPVPSRTAPAPGPKSRHVAHPAHTRLNRR